MTEGPFRYIACEGENKQKLQEDERDQAVRRSLDVSLHLLSNDAVRNASVPLGWMRFH
jgi:hypothetical protein